MELHFYPVPDLWFMRMMKLLNLILLYSLCLLSSVACQASGPVALSVEVIAPARAAKKLNIDHVYRTIQVKEKQYYAGFSIDSDGINHPVLIEANAYGRQQNRWEFEDIISDIFIFNGHVSVLLDTGRNFSLLKDIWVQNPQGFPQNARIIFSDGLRHLIVCSPSSLFKDSTHAAGCESFNPNWKVSFSWHDLAPKLCGDFLHALTWSNTQNQRLLIDPASGKVIEQSAYTGEDICAAFN
jgi:hypothetical protein